MKATPKPTTTIPAAAAQVLPASRVPAVTSSQVAGSAASRTRARSPGVAGNWARTPTAKTVKTPYSAMVMLSNP